MLKHGYEIGEVEISVGTNYNATGEAMAELLLKGRTEHCDISRFSPNRLLGV